MKPNIRCASVWIRLPRLYNRCWLIVNCWFPKWRHISIRSTCMQVIANSPQKCKCFYTNITYYIYIYKGFISPRRRSLALPIQSPTLLQSERILHFNSIKAGWDSFSKELSFPVEEINSWKERWRQRQERRNHSTPAAIISYIVSHKKEVIRSDLQPLHCPYATAAMRPSPYAPCIILYLLMPSMFLI